ncbi:MAG: O-antigen ligase family protein, partial [Acidobacteriota bacterium]
GAVLLSRSTAALGALIAALLTLAAGGGASWWKGRGDAVAGAVAAGVVLVALLGPIVAGRSTLAERAGMGGIARVEEPPTTRSWKTSPGVHWMRLRLLFERQPDVSVASRLRFSRATMLALRDEPVLGFGPGSVPLTFARYRLQVPGASPWGESVGQLHSVGLQRLYESGMAGLAAFAIWVLLSILGRPSADPARAWLRIGLAGGVAALAVAGAADALEPAPALVAVGFALIVLLSVRHEARTRERLPRWSLAVAGVGVILVALFAAADWLRSDLGQRREERAVLRVRNVLDGRIDAAVLEDLRAAVRLDPSLGLYAHQAAYAAEELALQSLKDGNGKAAAALFQESERLHHGVVRRFADVHGFASQAGNFLIDRDRPAEAIPYLRKAVALDYYNPLGHFYLGEAFRLLGREAEAIEAHARAIRFYPRLAAAALWSAPGAQELRRRVLERVRGLLLEESALHDPDRASGRLLRHIEHLLQEQAAPDGSTPYPRVLSARLDAVLGTSRAWHLFGRLGFAMENLPVTVLEAEHPPQEDAWARVLEGLPVLTAAELERPRQRQAPAGLREETDAKPAGRPPRQAGMRTGNGGQSA